MSVIYAAQVANTSEITYTAVCNGFASTSTTDIFVMQGSSSRIVQLIYCGVSAVTSGAAATYNINFVKRSGGSQSAITNTNLTVGGNDPLSSAHTLNLLGYYTSTPANVGTVVANWGADRIAVPTTASIVTGPVELTFPAGGQQGTLRGVAEAFSVNLAGVTFNATCTINIVAKWIERLP